MSKVVRSDEVELPNPQLITTDERLQSLSAELLLESQIACDTESNSLFAYRERVCLMQISTRKSDYLIDPLAVNLDPLRPIFASRKIEKIFHAAEYDLLCLKRDYKFTFENVFDTMIAARIVGRKQFGLAALLQEFFNVTADKRFQRADWSIRPLPPDQLLYAQQDTHFLPQLRDFLAVEIESAGRVAEALELFAALVEVQPGEAVFDEDGYWRLPGARDFSRREMARLRELYLWRDMAARKIDCPPFKVISDQALLALATENPANLQELRNLDAVPPAIARRFGAELLRVLAIGEHAPYPRRPPAPPPLDAQVRALYDALQQWRKNRAVARGVESDIILSKESMWAMAQNPPSELEDLVNVPGLGPWRRTTYGSEIIKVIDRALADFRGDDLETIPPDQP